MHTILFQLMEEAFAFQICEMQFDENRERYLISEYQEKGTADAVRLEFGNCGSGMLNILQLLAAILRYCPEKSEVVLLDCPDGWTSFSEADGYLAENTGRAWNSDYSDLGFGNCIA